MKIGDMIANKKSPTKAVYKVVEMNSRGDSFSFRNINTGRIIGAEYTDDDLVTYGYFVMNTTPKNWDEILEQ